MHMGFVTILGGAQTDFKRNFRKEGHGLPDLMREAAAAMRSLVPAETLEALKSEGRVACFVGNFEADTYVKQGHVGALLTEADPFFSGIPSARYEAACASGSVAVDAAIDKLLSGRIDLALVLGWELQKTVDPRTGGDFLGHASLYAEEAEGRAFPFPALFAQLAEAQVQKYKLDRARYLDALAVIAANNFANAKNNPLAQTRAWDMPLAHTRVRGGEENALVSGMLAVSDCSQITDGAAALALVSERYLQRFGTAGKPAAQILGRGVRVAPMRLAAKLAEAQSSPYLLPWTRRAVQEAFAEAHVQLADLDVIETHDCFTASEYAALSCFGITDPGREYEAVESGAIAMGGAMPVNPSGGLIGCGHPVGATGVRMLLDLYRQVTGQAGAYQVPGAKTAALLNIGGSATTNYAFVVGRA